MNDTVWTVVYSHGKGGDPWKGEKISLIRSVVLAAGANIVSIRYDENETVNEMIDRCADRCMDPEYVPGECILIGSSRGAYVAAGASREMVRRGAAPVKGIFMLAPAIDGDPGYYPGSFPIPAAERGEVIQGFGDTLFSYTKAVTFCRENGFRCHLLNAGHRLTEEKVLIARLLENFLAELMNVESN